MKKVIYNSDIINLQQTDKPWFYDKKKKPKETNFYILFLYLIWIIILFYIIFI
jgi:hypothetical protein